MTAQPHSRSVALIIAAAALSACATAQSPWDAHEATSGNKAALANGAAVCPVVIENGTDQMLDTRYSVVGMDFDIGLLPVGQSVSFDVQCHAGRVQAMATSHTVGFDEAQTRFTKTARLDPVRGTRLDITHADRVR